MALNDNSPMTRAQLKDMSVQELKDKRRELLPRIKELRRNPHVLVEELKGLKKLNLAVKTEIASRHIATEREVERLAKLAARPAADILQFPMPTPDTPDTLLEVFEIEPAVHLRAVGHVNRA